MASADRRCFFYGHEIQKVAEAKSEKDKISELDAIKINEQAKDLVKQRLGEVDSLWNAARAACLIEVNLDLELTGEDIVDTINTPDEQLHLLFPALTPTDCLRLKKTLTEKRPQFEQQLKDNDGIAVVPMSYSGNGIHMKEGWILTDARLCGTAIQAHNATFTFLGAGEEGSSKKKAVIFEPADRFVFNFRVKEQEIKSLDHRQPSMAFVKLGVQVTDDRGVDDFLDWELEEQQLIVDNKIPCFDVPQGNELDKDVKNYSILQLVPPGVRGATPTPPSIVTSIVDSNHIKALFPELGPCMMYEIEEMRRYLPQSGGIVFASEEKSFTLTGLIFTDYADPLKHPQDSFTKYNQILPFPRELNHIFENAKSFMLNRTGETLTEGTSLQYNYRALAEFTKSQMVASLSGTYNINFEHPRLEEGFTSTSCVDTLSFFAQEAAGIDPSILNQPPPQ